MNFTDMPGKVGGQHRWIAMATYTLTKNQAAAADAGADVTLDPRTMLVGVYVGCVDCELPYKPARLEPCPAGDEWSTL